MLPIIKDNFCYVGMEDGRSVTNLEETSYSEYTFYASGRKNCFYTLFKLDLEKRHCLLSRYGYEMLYEAKDTLSLDIPVRFAGTDYESPPPV
jgi:hypothetical protein